MKVTKIQKPSLPEMPVPKYVAAYCRVETLQEIRLHSLEVQKLYQLVLLNPRIYCIIIFK